MSDNNNQLVVAAVFAAVGYYVGGPTGAQIGWGVGMAVAAPTTRVTGPRLGENKITGTEYGQPIPWIAGHPRLAPQIWWQSERREVATTDTAGKGGGVKTTTFTYEMDAWFGLTDCEIDSVTRVWSNGKLIYVNLEDATDASLLASDSTAEWRRITVYTGAADQLPDPTYEAVYGAASPAYRGRGSVFIEGLQLGNQGILTNLTFEVAMGAVVSDDIVRRVFTTTEEVVFDGFVGPAGVKPAITQVEDEIRVAVFSDSDDTVYRWHLDGRYIGTDTRDAGDDFPDPTIIGAPTTFPIGILAGQHLRVANKTLAYGSATVLYVGGYPGTNVTSGVVPNGEFYGGAAVCTDGYHLLVFTAPSSAMGGAAIINKWYLMHWDGAATLVRSGTLEVARAITQNGQGNSTDAPLHNAAVMSLENDLLHVWYVYGPVPEITMFRLDADNVMREKDSRTSFDDQWTELPSGAYPSVYAKNGFCTVVGQSSEAAPGGATVTTWRRAGDTIVEATLQGTVDRLLELAQMPAGSTDTTALAAITKPVRALAVSQISTVRSTLEVLAAGYFFEVFATDKLYFVPRAGSVAGIIDANYMGVGVDQGEPDLLPTTIGNDGEIPAQVALSYSNVDADYNTATEHSDRLGTSQVTTRAIQLALGLTSSEAKGVADAIVLDGYASRVSGNVALPLRYAKITPTDVWSVPDEAGNVFRVRLVRRKDSGSLLEFEWVLDDASAVESAGITSDDYTPSVTVVRPAATVMVLADIPLLRDQDDSPGIYVGARGDGGSYPGSTILSSPDDVTFETEGTVTASAILGTVTVALSGYIGGNTFDEAGSVTVDIGLGNTMSSSTHDAVLNDETVNAAMVGDELIQFRLATLVSDGVYKLTGLLRGRRGTEHSMTAHAIGEDFLVLRTAGMIRAQTGATQIGSTRHWIGVTLGRATSTATSVPFVDTGVSMMPLAPVDLRADTSVDGLYTITWGRRSRYAYRWPAITALPIGEVSESWLVELYDLTDALVDSQTVSTAQATFSTAQRSITLDEGIGALAVISGAYYGVQLEGPGPRYVLQIDTVGTVTGTSAYIGDSATAMVTNAGMIFVAGNVLSSGTPQTVLDSDVYRIDPTALTAMAASYSFVQPGDPHILCHDGTHLWAPGYFSGNLIKLDGTTLALVSSTALGTGLWGIATDNTLLYITNRDTGDVFAYDPVGSPSEHWRVSPSVGGAVELLYRGGLLYVACTDSVLVLDPATGATLFTHAGAPTFGTGTVPLVSFGAYVVYRRVSGGYVVFLDAATGDIAFEVNLPAITYLTGADGATLFTIGSPTLSFTNYETWGYELNPSLAGFDVRVRQISAVVGPGYTATLTL